MNYCYKQMHCVEILLNLVWIWVILSFAYVSCWYILWLVFFSSKKTDLIKDEQNEYKVPLIKQFCD